MGLELKILVVPPCYLMHRSEKIVSGVRLFSSYDRIVLAERVLHDEFSLTDERSCIDGTPFRKGSLVVGLAVQRSGPGTEYAHVHLHYQHSQGSHVYLHHLTGNMVAEDFTEARTDTILRRIYLFLQPKKVTDAMLKEIAWPL